MKIIDEREREKNNKKTKGRKEESGDSSHNESVRAK